MLIIYLLIIILLLLLILIGMNKEKCTSMQTTQSANPELWIMFLSTEDLPSCLLSLVLCNALYFTHGKCCRFRWQFTYYPPPPPKKMPLLHPWLYQLSFLARCWQPPKLAVTPSNISHMSCKWVGLTSQCFDQYILIIFRRMIDVVLSMILCSMKS